jgi:hypothetical protein
LDTCKSYYDCHKYRKKNRRWFNPFQDLDAPLLNSVPRDSLPEDEFLKLFEPGVLKNTMELAVRACMFLSGLRRGEIATLTPDCRLIEVAAALFAITFPLSNFVVFSTNIAIYAIKMLKWFGKKCRPPWRH